MCRDLQTRFSQTQHIVYQLQAIDADEQPPRESQHFAEGAVGELAPILLWLLTKKASSQIFDWGTFRSMRQINQYYSYVYTSLGRG